MSRPIRAATAVVLLVLLVPASATAHGASLGIRLARALQARHVSPARTGAVVVDLQSGRVVYSDHPGEPLLPASNEKLGTTYAALTALGPDFRIETDVLGDGTQEGETWRGDLVLKGYGDPTLSSADLMTLARQVLADGIRRVSGRLLGDESWFDTRRTGRGWKPEFYLHESPALSALIVNRGWNGYEERDPALTAAQLFRQDLRRVGIRVAGPTALGVASAAGVPLAEVESPTVGSLVRYMDTVSDNFTAEMLIKEVGAVQGRGGTTAAGLAVTRRLLAAAGVPLARVRLVDGSGLSRLDRWTPRGLAYLLRVMWLDPDVHPYFVHSLPVAGETGTLDYRMKRGAARGLVRAKTGTTDNSSALSGYAGDRYAFSIVENGYPVHTRNAEASQNRFAEVLAQAARR